MIVSFNTQELRDRCASLERAEAAFGPAHAQELISVLSDAEAVETAAELIALHAPNAQIDGDSVSLWIGARFRLSFVALGAALVRDRDIGIDWGEVIRVKIMDISRC